MKKPGIIGLYGPTVNNEVTPAMRPFTIESNKMVEAEVLRTQTRQPALTKAHKLVSGDSCGWCAAKT